MDLFKKGAIIGMITGTALAGIEFAVLGYLTIGRDMKNSRKFTKAITDILSETSRKQIELMRDYFECIHKCRHYLLTEKEIHLRALLTQYILELTEGWAECDSTLSGLWRIEYDRYCIETGITNLSQALNQFQCDCNSAIYKLDTLIKSVANRLKKHEEELK